ncbi:NADPH-dependent FMN reductase [Prosthecobacter vanneervenii]|uniref:NAD(P)H-dependent FMN reductase n=1 Tax=Prosthecobacter vanneervenii TaxID=48466 RepID=A0A7W8DJT0_9BACT|nr:NAD(P)H-dependent oxidoreductase [Prosthecobacter vanneervenii]MBB5032464.1 NAD(P)H-dependent FMN reductase [Prosthecobacter vanneervenii]
MSTPKILVFAGSTRSASYNKQLARFAAEAARSAGAEVTLLDLRDYALPLFDEDLEEQQGLPENAKKLKTLFRGHDAFIIASPEYNSSITAVLKNTLDWISRSESDDEPALVAFRGKTALLLGASPGGFGGMRGLVHLRAILGNIGVIVLPDQVVVPKAHEVFDGAGGMKDERAAGQVTRVVKGLVDFQKKLAS